MLAITLALALTAAAPAQPAMRTVCVLTDASGACVASYRERVPSKAIQAWVAQQAAGAGAFAASPAATTPIAPMVDVSALAQGGPQSYRVLVNGEGVRVTILE